MQQHYGYGRGRVGVRREPGVVLLLTIVTFGIYYLIWVYEVSKETQEFLGEKDTDPGLEVVLCLLTCGLYILYWDYKMAQKIARMQHQVGLPVQDNAVLYLILNLLGVGFVNGMLEQGHLNHIWEQAQGNTHPKGQGYGSPYR